MIVDVRETCHIWSWRRKKKEGWATKAICSGTFLRLNILLVLMGIIPWGCWGRNEATRLLRKEGVTPRDLSSSWPVSPPVGTEVSWKNIMWLLYLTATCRSSCRYPGEPAGILSAAEGDGRWRGDSTPLSGDGPWPKDRCPSVYQHTSTRSPQGFLLQIS